MSAQAPFKVKRGNKTSSAPTKDIFEAASLESALQGALEPHAHLSHSSPSHYIKDFIPLVLVGKATKQRRPGCNEAAAQHCQVPSSLETQLHLGTSAHTEISEGNVHRSVERSCPCLRLNPAAVEHPHYSYRSWDTYMTKSTRQCIRGKLKQHAESSYPPCLQSTNRLQHPLWLLLLLFLTCCYAAFMSAQRTKPQLATKYMY